MRYLTVVDPKLERAEAQTPEGMAHWAGTGPAGATCGACVHYGYGYITKSDRHRNRPRACAKYFAMAARHGGNLDEEQVACKYFELREGA